MGAILTYLANISVAVEGTWASMAGRDQ